MPYLNPASRLLCLLFLASIVSIGNAEEDIYFTEEDYFSFNPLISDASRLPTRKHNSPVPVSVITREMIEASGAINVADLFRLVPGYQVGHPNGGQFAVNPHDLSERLVKRIEVRVNGVSVYNSLSATTLWDRIGVEVEDIDRIEITRSSNSVSHGFNSFMGSINIITISPLKEHGTSLKARAGNFDFQSWQLRHSNNIGDFHFRIGLDHRSDDGFASVDDDSDRSNMNFHSIYTPTLQDEIEFGANIAKTVFRRGDIEPPGTPATFNNVEQDSSMQYLKWNHHFANSNLLAINFHHLISKFDSSPTLIPLGPVTASLDTDGMEQRYETNISYLINNLDNIRWQIGGALRYEIIDDANIIRNERLTRFSQNIFTSLDWNPHADWLINTAILVQSSNDNNLTFNPRISTNYQFHPAHTFRAHLSYSERNPVTVNQKQFIPLRLPDNTVVGLVRFADDEIDNERMLSYGIGYNGSFFNNRMELDLQIYRQDVNDGIDDFPTPPPFGIIPSAQKFDNTSDWRTTGFETELKFRICPDSFLHLNYGYADIDGKRLRGINPEVFESIDDALAQHSLGVLVSKQFANKLSVSSAYYYQSDMRWLGQNGTVQVNRLDFRANKTFKIASSELDLGLIMQGLLGEYDELQVDNTFEPRAIFELGLSF